MALVVREFKIVYGSITLGAGTDYIIDGTSPITLSKNYSTATLGATVIVTGSSESNFNTNCTTLEAAFRVPRATLQVILGSTTMWDYNATNNTGFNCCRTIFLINKDNLIHPFQIARDPSMKRNHSP